MAIKWLFFDIGSTLVDETEAYNHRIREMLQGTTVDLADFDCMRIHFAKQGPNGDSEAINHFGLKKHLGTVRMRFRTVMLPQH